MKKSAKCPKCGSEEVIADAKAIDRYDVGCQEELSVGVYRRPEALIFKDQRRSTLSAWVCGSCGYVEFYADSPRRIMLPKTEKK